MDVKRHVSVIMYADIVGYTSMMQQDEQNALLKIDCFEKTLKKEAKNHDGEIIKMYGDGSLLLFASAVEAIFCAIKIQKTLQKKPLVPLRIGLHIGEIVRKGQDVFGDGINIASRIESMGQANAVLISENVYFQVKNKPKILVQNLGAFKFKNVEQSIDLYAIANDNLFIPSPKQMRGKGVFKNAKLFSVKKQVASVLILLIILLGLTAYYYSSKFISSLEQNELTIDFEALDYYLKGEFHHKKETLSDLDTAIVYYENAIRIDPKFAKAYDQLGNAYMRKFLSFDSNTRWEAEAYSAAGKALQINPDLVNPHIIRGQFFWSPSHNFAHEEAINEFSKAIKKDPELSQAYEQLALIQFHIGLFKKALKNAYKSIKLEPGNYRARRFIAEALFFQGKYEESLLSFGKIPENFAPQPTQALRALNLFYLNQTEKARDLLNQNLQSFPNNPNGNSVYAILLASEGKEMEARQKMEIAIENADELIHAHHVYYHLAIASAIMKNKDEALEWLSKASRTGFPNYPLFHSDPFLSTLKGFGPFDDFMKDLNKKWMRFQTL